MTVKDLRDTIANLPNETVVKVWNSITEDGYIDAETIVTDPDDKRPNIVISDLAGD